MTTHIEEFVSVETVPAAWPEPVNVLSELAAPSLPADALPESLGAFAEGFAQATGFDASMTIAAVVTVAAAALSDAFQIVADSSTRRFQQARLWQLTIGRPGAGKTPAQREMLTPLWALHRELTKAWERDAAGLEDPKAAPPRPRLIVTDTTIEALSEVLRDNPRGVLIATEEFESWIGSQDTYRRGNVSRDRGEWLRTFDGGPHTIERVQRGSVYVENWGVSILTATTPAALAKIMRQLPDDGLLQRFIPVIARSRIDPKPVADLDARRERYAETIRRLFAARPRAHNGCVPLSLEAQTFFREWERSIWLLQEAFGSTEPAIEGHFAKYPTFLLRLALTFHAANVVNHEHEQARDPAAWPVPASTLRSAAEFLKRASLHAIALYLRRDGSETYELVRSTARGILAIGGDMITRRDLLRRVRAFRDAPPEQQAAAIRLLMDFGWLRYGEGGYRKEMPTRYDLNPRLAEKFAELAERERERRAILRELIAEVTNAP